MCAMMKLAVQQGASNTSMQLQGQLQVLIIQLEQVALLQQRQVNMSYLSIECARLSEVVAKAMDDTAVALRLRAKVFEPA